MRILNRTVTWSNQGITYEADQRHAEICLKEIGLAESNRLVSTPTDRSAKDLRNRDLLNKEELSQELLNPSTTTRYKAIVARLDHLGTDKSEIQFAIKDLGKHLLS